MSDKIDKMETVEQQVAGNIVARSQVLRRDAEESALLNGILTAVIQVLDETTQGAGVRGAGSRRAPGQTVREGLERD